MGTYIPGLNTVVFEMGPMRPAQWGLVFIFMLSTFFLMEAEKALRRVIKASGGDTDDNESFIFDTIDEPKQDITLPKGTSHLKLTQLKRVNETPSFFGMRWDTPEMAVLIFTQIQ